MSIKFLLTLIVLNIGFVTHVNASIKIFEKPLFSKWKTSRGEVLDLSECNLNRPVSDTLYICWTTVKTHKENCTEQILFEVGNKENKFWFPLGSCSERFIGNFGHYNKTLHTLTFKLDCLDDLCVKDTHSKIMTFK